MDTPISKAIDDWAEENHLLSTSKLDWVNAGYELMDTVCDILVQHFMGDLNIITLEKIKRHVEEKSYNKVEFLDKEI